MSRRAWGLHLARPSRRLGWALLLALLLPLAQAAAAHHTITHHGTPAQQRDGAPSTLHASGTHCVLAAPLGAGAPPSAAAPLPVADAAHTAPAAPSLDAPASAPALAYRSRAPPVRLH